jgi:glycosyltransferase involved in cell wall biosynthesis
MAELIRADLPPEQHDKVIVIHNWADGERIQPVPRKDHPLLREWNLAGKFVVQYSGNIGLFHEIETVIAAAEQLRDREDIAFLFIGEGGQLPRLRQRAKDENLSNIVFQPFQPRERLPLSLTACDAAVVSLKEEATGCCVPSKLYGVLAAGRPVLAVANEKTETARTITRGQCGAVVAPGDSEKLKETILAWREAPGEVETLGKAARELFDNDFTVARIASAYEDAVKQCVRRSAF